MGDQLPTHFNFARDVVERWAKERPDALALWCVREHGLPDQKLTFRQLSEHLRRAASFFDQIGVRRGDRGLIIAPRVSQWWIAMLGLTRLGAVPIPGTPMLTVKDISYRLDAAEATAMITDADGADKAKGLEITHRILIGGKRPSWTSFEEGLPAGDPGFAPEPTPTDEPGILYFTSGTTGPPKMVLHTQASYGLGHRITGEL